MHLFWQHGYEGASLDGLRRAMGGISSASFYAAFGSKEALYREALAVYLASHGTVVAPLSDRTLGPRARLEATLRCSAAMQTEDGHPRGCMVTLSAIVGPAASISLQELTADARAINRAAILGCVEEGIARAELRADVQAVGLATLFEALLVGLSIQARDGVEGGAIDAAITQALAAWDANTR